MDWELFTALFFDGDTPIYVKMLALIKITRLLRASRLIDNITAGKTDGFCITNDGFCITNDGFCIKNDELSPQIGPRILV